MSTYLKLLISFFLFTWHFLGISFHSMDLVRADAPGDPAHADPSNCQERMASLFKEIKKRNAKCDQNSRAIAKMQSFARNFSGGQSQKLHPLEGPYCLSKEELIYAAFRSEGDGNTSRIDIVVDQYGRPQGYILSEGPNQKAKEALCFR